MQPQKEQTHLYKTLQTLDMFYLQEVLGDCFVTIETQANQSHIAPTKQSQPLLSQVQQVSPQHTDKAQHIFQNLYAEVLHCRLCSLAKIVKEKHRFCGIAPIKQDEKEPNSPYKKIPNIAFIVETLHLTRLANNPHVTIESLDAGKIHEMLFDIIQKVFLLDKESVFLLPLFKCAEVGDNQSLSALIRQDSLATERRICSPYLRSQLEYMEYAVFFGTSLCHDFFETTLQEASGKLLEHYTQSGKKVTCICVPDIFAMLMNPKLKKDAFINFVLLKNAMYANSC